MAALTTFFIAAAVGIGGYSAYEGHKARVDQADAYKAEAAENRKAQGEQKALNYQQQAIERRSQIREERVRMGKLMQSSENGGTAGSSGEYGAAGSLVTQLGNNLGINAGRAQAANAIGGYQQNAADFNLAAQQAGIKAQNMDALFSLSTSIFSAAGGFKGK